MIKYNNYEFEEVSYIEGVGCEGEEKNGIFIYEGARYGNGKLIKSILREPGFHHDKWDFINENWSNYVKSLEYRNSH